MILELTGQEITQFQYILPLQGSLKTLEVVKRIFDKIDEKISSGMTESIEIDFDKDEIEMMKNTIDFLDQEQKLSIQSLSLIHKIIKQEKL